MKLSHCEENKDLIKSKDLADYYSSTVEGIAKDIKQAMLILNPYNGHMFYDARLMAFAMLLSEIAERVEKSANEF